MANQEVKPLQSQVKLDATVGQAPYSASFDAAALTPTLMGQLGASMSLNAAQELSKRRGIQAGMNPSGDSLPAITAADKSYVDAYQNQAQATLTNQAQVLFDKSQESMASLGNLSAGSIAEYQKTLHEGLGDILEMAPNDVKASLANQFTQQIESSSHHYRLQMNAQQKQASLSKSNAALSQITQQIHGAAMDGNTALADRLHKDSVAMIDRGQGSGMYSASQAQTLKHTSRLTLLSSLEIKKGLEAKRAGKMDTYLDNLADETKKPQDISWTDWESVRSNSAKYLKNIRSLESQHQQIIASNGYVDIAQGTMTAEKMEQLRGDLNESPLLYNNLAISFASQQRARNAKSNDDNHYAQEWQNIDALRDATPKKIDGAFNQLVGMKLQQAQQMGNPISQEEAEFQTAASSAVPVPAYNRKLANYLTSGNPDLMVQGLQDFKRLNAYSGNKTSAVLSNPKAMAMMNTFEGFLEQGKDSQTAAAMAEEIVYKKTPEQIELNSAQIQRQLTKHGSTPSSLNSWVNRLAGVGSDTTIVNQAALTSTVVGMYKENMQWTNANEDVSVGMIEQAFNKAWGISEVNGKKEMTYLPIEKTIGLDKGAVPIMQLQIAEQIKMQVADTRRAYDQGQSEFYYQVKERPDYDEFINSKNAIREKGLSDPLYATNSGIVKQFESGAPVELERVYRSGSKESFTANIISNAFQGIDQSTGQLKGDYDIGLVNKTTGANESFIGIFGSTHITPVFRPNVQHLKNSYLQINGINPQDFTREETQKKIDAFKKKQQSEQDSLPLIQQSVNTFARGLR